VLSDEDVHLQNYQESRMNIGERSSVTLLLSSETTMGLKRQIIAMIKTVAALHVARGKISS